MALSTPRPTQVFFVIDESGSMINYTKHVRESVSNIIDSSIDPAVRFNVIVFSDTAEHTTDISKLKRPAHSNTYIPSAFKKLHEVVRATPIRHAPERIVVVFISDGMDYNVAKCTVEIRGLPRLPVPSILLSVGVGRDFPTGLVVDVLRPKYHQESAALPSVLPVKTPDDLPWAFGQVEALLLTEILQRSRVPSRVDNDTPTRDLMGYTRAKYNECVIKCAESGRAAKDNYQLLTDAVAAIHCVAKMAKTRIHEARAAAKASCPAEGAPDLHSWEEINPQSEEETTPLMAETNPPNPRMKPTVSNLIKNTIYSPKACLSLALSLIRRLNTMLESACKGQLISDLSDEAKQELIGFVYTEGKFMGFASKYRAANIATTKKSLMRLLQTYQPKPQDVKLTDPINLSDQAEYFADARDNLLDLIPFTHTLPGILRMLPFVGRTITFREPFPIDAMQANEWLAEVGALPMVHRTMTTYDFYVTYKEKFESRGETVNCLMVLGGDHDSPGIFHHVQSMLLMKHPGLFVLTARLAVAASVLTFILGHHSKYEGWMDQELEAVRDICAWYTPSALQDWHLYLDDIRSPDFRRCLVQESPKLPKHCRCPALTKYILAMYVAITGADGTAPHLFTVEELYHRHWALVVEFVSQSRARFFDFYENVQVASPENFINKAWAQESSVGGLSTGEMILDNAVTLKQARDMFAAVVQKSLEALENSDSIVVGTQFIRQRVGSIFVHQLNIKRINSAFAHLARLCGISNYGTHPDTNIMNNHALIRVLYTVHSTHSSYDRCTAPVVTTPMPIDELRSILSSHFTAKFRKAVGNRLEDFIAEKYNQAHAKAHAGVARPIPQAYIERFREEIGLDIGVDWGVGAAGLSTLACCNPDCPRYLDLLEMPAKAAKGSKEGSDSQRAAHGVVCRRLRQHLFQGGSSPTVQGFHKTVAAFQNLSPSEIGEKIAAGECLCDPYPTKDDLQRLSAITGRFRSICTSGSISATGSISKAGSISKTGSISKLLVSKDDWHRMEQELAALKQAQVVERKHEMISHLKRALDTHSGADPDFLRCSVARLQGELKAPQWTYAEFRSIFLSKYKMYSQLTQHLPTPLPMQ